MTSSKLLIVALSLLTSLALVSPAAEAGLIKDLFQKASNTGNKAEDTVKQSVPICGSGIFSTSDESSISPELIFISTRPSRVEAVRSQGDSSRGRHSGNQDINELAKEFSFHADNVTLDELRRYGFNPDAPVSFLIHGFTDGYPLQAWISAIVEAYTIDRESHNSDQRRDNDSPHYLRESSASDRYPYNSSSHKQNHHKRDTYNSQRGDRSPNSNRGSSPSSPAESSSSNAQHNLFIVNWHYGARGILYPRAVANVPIVASYVTRFINNKLIDEAHVDPRRIQLIGHSLGAHLAGFIGKNTRSKVGRIYGLDPAGPCFGAVSGPLYPASKRLAPSDADEVVTIQTNSVLLGIEKPLGTYSVFVEGGADQPGCKPSGVLKSIGTLTFDGGDFDTIACSHLRAPNLLTYRHDQADGEDNCQMVAYACQDWDSFLAGHCGVCADSAQTERPDRLSRNDKATSPLEPVQCYRIGLDWQYPSSSSAHSTARPHPNDDNRPLIDDGHSNNNEDEHRADSLRQRSSTRRPEGYEGSSFDNYSTRPPRHPASTQSRRPVRNNSTLGGPGGGADSNYERLRRATESTASTNSTASDESPGADERRASDDSVEPIVMFLRTSDTHPYCTFHYQVVLELNEPFGRRKPHMSIILQDSRPDSERGQQQRRGAGAHGGGGNSLIGDEFGHKFDDKTYTQLLISNRRLARVDQATLIVRDGLPDGHRVLKRLHVNYMSSIEERVRARLSSRLCPVRTEIDRSASDSQLANTRFYFKPCGQAQQQYGDSSSAHQLSEGGSQSYERARESGHKQASRRNHQN